MGTVGFGTSLAGCSAENTGSGTTTRQTTAETSGETVTSNEQPTETQVKWEVDPVDTDRLVIAEYLPWWFGEDGWGADRNGGWLENTPSTPVLGEYRSTNEDVVNQHIKWAVEHGINVFSVNTGLPNRRGDQINRDIVMDAELADEISFINQIDIQPRFYDEDGNLVELHDDNGNVDFSKPEVRSLLTEWHRHHSEHYFNQSNYLTLDNGRPVLYYYNAGNPVGDVAGAWEEAKNSIAEDPYVIGYIGAGNEPGNPLGLTPASKFGEVYDAFNSFNPYTPLAFRHGDEVDLGDVMDVLHDWAVAAKDYEIEFLPTVLPGFDETAKEEKTLKGRDYLPVWERDADRFREFCDRALDYIDTELDAVYINGFNGWIEDTQVEPGESYGTTYLEIVRDELAHGTPDPSPIRDYVPLELKFDRTVARGMDDSNPLNDRELAFYLSEVTVIDAAGMRTTYPADSPSEQPLVFTAGAYPASEGARWLGGPEGRARLYLGPEANEATELVISGRPIESGIGADLNFDGESMGQITFDSGGEAEYTVQVLNA